MDFSNPVIGTNFLNEGEMSHELFDQGIELSDDPDKEGELEGHEQDWQLNVVVKFNINPGKVISYREDSKSKRMTVTETTDGLHLLKGLPILAIDDQEIVGLDSLSVEEMWSTQNLPVVVKFGREPLVELNSVNTFPRESILSFEDHIMFLGETSSIVFEDGDQKMEYSNELEIVHEEQSEDLELQHVDELQPICFEGTQGDQSSWSQKCKKRAEIITELLDTEKSYIRGLEQLNNGFLKLYKEPLKKSVNVDIESFQTKIQTLISLHDKIYHKFCSSENICIVFQKEFRFLKMYKMYIRDYKETYTKLLKASKRRAFKRIFRNGGRKFSFDALGFFQTRAITIVQRPPRYILLLRELKKNTQLGHPMYEDLEKGLFDIEEICGDINEHQRQLENEFKFVKLSEEVDLKTLKLHGIKELVIPARRLVRYGKVAIKKIQSTGVLSMFRLADAGQVFELGCILMCNDILIIMNGKKNRVVRVFILSETETELNNEPIQPSNNDQKIEKVYEVVIKKRSADKRRKTMTSPEKERYSVIRCNRLSSPSLELSPYLESFYNENSFSIYLSTLEEAEEWETSILKYSKLAYVN